MENAVSSGIAGFKWNANDWILVAHLFKGSADWDRVLCIEKEGTNLGFRGGCSNTAERFAKNMNDPVWCGIWWRAGGRRVIGKEEMAGGATASIW